VLRRLDLLTEQIARLPEHWKQSSELRAHYCGYNSLKELSKFNIDHVKHSKLKEDEKLLKEQFWHLTELVRMLDEDVRNENYGRWIYLRR
jgi:hypothetical protein